ncbi:hypothetical protein GCM10010412_075590 [Nonomuraea recticatena]|uniref:Uncharacterized protein n=1 Tax=Nonomuraea recticatena TaxID=46178 RepID=A0ABN3SYI7_9ACTN
MRPLDRVAEDRDEPRPWNGLAHAALGVQVVEVEGGGLAEKGAFGRVVEQRLVVGSAPDVLAVGLGVSGAAVGGRRPVGEEELGLLDPRQVKCGMLAERGVQGSGAGLRGADHQEVRQRHRPRPSYSLSFVIHV